MGQRSRTCGRAAGCWHWANIREHGGGCFQSVTNCASAGAALVASLGSGLWEGRVRADHSGPGPAVTTGPSGAPLRMLLVVHCRPWSPREVAPMTALSRADGAVTHRACEGSSVLVRRSLLGLLLWRGGPSCTVTLLPDHIPVVWASFPPLSPSNSALLGSHKVRAALCIMAPRMPQLSLQTVKIRG